MATYTNAQFKKLKKIKVKLRPCKMDVLGKGYHPIYRTVDEKGITLTYLVKLKDFALETNTLKEARVLAVKM